MLGEPARDELGGLMRGCGARGTTQPT